MRSFEKPVVKHHCSPLIDELHGQHNAGHLGLLTSSRTAHRCSDAGMKGYMGDVGVPVYGISERAARQTFDGRNARRKKGHVWTSDPEVMNPGPLSARFASNPATE